MCTSTGAYRMRVLFGLGLGIIGLMAAGPAMAAVPDTLIFETFSPALPPPDDPGTGSLLHQIFPVISQVAGVVEWHPLLNNPSRGTCRINYQQAVTQFGFQEVVIMKTRDVNDPADTTRSEWLGGFDAMPPPDGDFPPFHWIFPLYCPVASLVTNGWQDNGNGQFGVGDILIWHVQPPTGPAFTDTVLVTSVATGARLTTIVFPATGKYSLAALALLLAGSGAWAFRRRFALRGARTA